MADSRWGDIDVLLGESDDIRYAPLDNEEAHIQLRTAAFCTLTVHRSG